MSFDAFRPRIEPRGPAHFNEVINQPVSFINEEGSVIKTTVYEAAKSADAVAEKLKKRVIAHCNARKGSEYLDDKRQYDKLGELLGRINSVVILLEQDKGAFRPETAPLTASRVISTTEDVSRVSKELHSIAEKIKTEYLTKGSIKWYLPDYMEALKGMSKV